MAKVGWANVTPKKKCEKINWKVKLVYKAGSGYVCLFEPACLCRCVSASSRDQKEKKEKKKRKSDGKRRELRDGKEQR